MTISFKIFGSEAADLLSEIHRLSFQAAYEQIWSAGALTLLLEGPGVQALVVLEQGQPVGFLLWREVDDEAEILTLCIVPDYRIKGLASQLLQEFYQISLGHGVKDFFLEVNECNKAALALYGRNGFETVGRRKDYYGDQAGHKKDALVMKYSI